MFGQRLDTQSDTKIGWQSAQAEMMWSSAKLRCMQTYLCAITQFCSSPLMLTCTLLENSIVLGFGIWAWMKHELCLTLGLNYIQISSISNLAAPQVLWPRCQQYWAVVTDLKSASCGAQRFWKQRVKHWASLQEDQDNHSAEWGGFSWRTDRAGCVRELQTGCMGLCPS